MSTAGSASSSQCHMSHGSRSDVDSHPKSVNEFEANQPKLIEIEDDEEEDEEEENGVEVGSKRKLTLVVWKEFKTVRWCSTVKPKCMYCSSLLGGETRSGTKHPTT